MYLRTLLWPLFRKGDHTPASYTLTFRAYAVYKNTIYAIVHHKTNTVKIKIMKFKKALKESITGYAA